jgi:hypothetical protein
MVSNISLSVPPPLRTIVRMTIYSTVTAAALNTIFRTQLRKAVIMNPSFGFY